MVGERWEYGSDFHWPSPKELMTLARSDGPQEISDKPVFYGSGRAALLAVLKHGVLRRGWERLFVPTYFCPEVMLALKSSGMEIKGYGDNPLRKPAGLPEEKLTSRDVVLRVNYFGWRSTECVLSSEELGCDVIEDHTHDPVGAWAQQSQATFCFASLRKTCPIPDGAILWSPAGQELPGSPGISEEHLCASNMKLGGMILKQAYLGGASIQKDDFRRLLEEGEGRFDKAGMIGMSPVSQILMTAISQKDLRKHRLDNFMKFRSLGMVPQANYPDLQQPEGTVPFSIVLLLEDRTRRDLVRNRLIERRVYPAVLWNLAEKSDAATNGFASRMLSLPCDFRYGEKDLRRLGHILQTVLF